MLKPQNRLRLSTLSKIALGLFWLMLFVGTHLPVDPQILGPDGRDKIVHFGAYFTLALLVAITWQLATGVLSPRHLIFAWIGIAVYCAFDEITQIPVGRDCEFGDWAADVCGAAAGLVIFALVSRTIARHG